MFGMRSRVGQRVRWWAAGFAVLAMVAAAGEPVRADTVVKVPNDAGTFDASVIAGDFNGDGRTDLALTGATTWRNVPVAFANGDGGFDLKYSPAEETDEDIARFSLWAAAAGTQILSGDFDADGRTDLALTGATTWRNMPVAFSNGDGTFKVTNAESSDFASWASEPGVTVTTGDFNRDGRTDVALTPGPKSRWTGLPVALSNGDGTFDVRNEPLPDFASRAQETGARITAGDFNRDGNTDLALTGGPKWETLPVALSKGDGTFDVRNEPLPDFASRAQETGARVTTGDFNRDGNTDLALTGGPKWETLPVALSKGDGTFDVRNEPLPDFASRAQETGARVTTGDFNRDGNTDLALTGGPKWETLPVALSKGDGTFDVRDQPLPDFASRAQETGAIVVSGDFDANGSTDMLLTGVAGWTSLPVAWSDGEAHFTLTDVVAGDFPMYVALGPSIDFPGRGPGGHPTGLEASAKMVTVKWYDRSDNERGFQVDKRDQNGNWQVVHRVPTRNVPGTGQYYTWVDTGLSISGQCYRIGAYNDLSVAFTDEICTVRPDPDAFPQAVGKAALQWYGLSNTNDGTGPLTNTNYHHDVVYGERTFGVNLDWADTSLWRVQAKGGPHLMKGQAVALRVWGGGWLKYGSQTFGVDLQLSDVPVYEWYVLGEENLADWATGAGEPLACCGSAFALWNSTAGEYLVHGSETWGIDLKWYTVGGSQPTPPPPDPTPTSVKNVPGGQLHLAAGAHPAPLGEGPHGRHPWTSVGSQGSNWTNYGSCGTTTYSGSPFSYNVPTSGHYYELVAVDTDPDYCGLVEPDPNVAFNCVRMDSTPFLGSTTSSVVVTAAVD